MQTTVDRQIKAAFIFAAQNGLAGDVQETRYSIVAPSGKELATGTFVPTPSRVEAGGTLTDVARRLLPAEPRRRGEQADGKRAGQGHGGQHVHRHG